ncbi:hypothetical protein CVT26_012024 [Gymnopilus dilepis]|uniref:F-box domain-containing protein n=1 Tax=Gymnopilus dilepis TaxID=231916 RepID=A0A409YHU0_9AGAR|nr:hypothetical protein CVT26_012024 [Gymnopilus dilepis]
MPPSLSKNTVQPATERQALNDVSNDRMGMELYEHLHYTIAASSVDQNSKKAGSLFKCRSYSASQSRKRHRDLSSLLNMPLDLLFEIFGHLNPKDILNLLVTSKRFYDTLSAPSATTIWKEARQRVGAPDPPSFMTEIRWAILVFRNICHNCNIKIVHKIDFSLLRRLCRPCRKTCLITEHQIASTFSQEILGLLLFTFVKGRPQEAVANVRVFYSRDVEETDRKYRFYQLAVLKHGNVAQNDFDTFVSKRLQWVQEMIKKAAGYTEWNRNFVAERQLAKQEVRIRRRETTNLVCIRIIERFIQLGYTEDDLHCIMHLPILDTIAPLTDNAWKRIRSTLEPQIAERMRERLEREAAREAALVKGNRELVAETIYDNYKSTLSPAQWRTLPENVDVCDLEPFRQVIDLPLHVPVTASDFEEALNALPGLLARKFDERLLTMESCMDRVPSPYPSDADVANGAYYPPNFGDNVMDLASSIFICSNPHCSDPSRPVVMVGAEEIMAHPCNQSSDAPMLPIPYFGCMGTSSSSEYVSFSQKGSDIAITLIRLAGLDPQNALVFEMDNRGIYFCCRLCTSGCDFGSQEWVSSAFSWRAAIAHELENIHARISSGSAEIWSVLPIAKGQVRNSQTNNI